MRIFENNNHYTRLNVTVELQALSKEVIVAIAWVANRLLRAFPKGVMSSV